MASTFLDDSYNSFDFSVQSVANGYVIFCNEKRYIARTRKEVSKILAKLSKDWVAG